MNYKGSGKVHFGVDDVSLYGTPKEELGPGLPGQEVKQSFLKNQLQALFQPTDNKLAMKLFGSKKALMKERIRQKAAGHWVIHPCSSFRWVPILFSLFFSVFLCFFSHPPFQKTLFYCTPEYCFVYQNANCNINGNLILKFSPIFLNIYSQHCAQMPISVWIIVIFCQKQFFQK